jgi:hypothetical protein
MSREFMVLLAGVMAIWFYAIAFWAHMAGFL